MRSAGSGSLGHSHNKGLKTEMHSMETGVLYVLYSQSFMFSQRLVCGHESLRILQATV